MFPIHALLSVLLCGLVLTGCTSDGEPRSQSGSGEDAPVVQLGAPGEDNRTLSPEEQESLADAPAHTQADVEFVQRMIPHHQQALEMTALVERRAADRRLTLLAERIEVSQLDEIAQLRDWLVQRGEAVPQDHHGGHQNHHAGHAEVMPGMLTKAELAELGRARGERFDRMFLASMIRHHQGAVQMVGDLLSGGTGGQEPAVFQIAQHIDSDQRVEISRMSRMLRR